MGLPAEFFPSLRERRHLHRGTHRTFLICSTFICAMSHAAQISSASVSIVDNSMGTDDERRRARKKEDSGVPRGRYILRSCGARFHASRERLLKTRDPLFLDLPAPPPRPRPVYNVRP